jgi:histidinol-phosphate/aromatic aminotransferase/cobyric acid decarboxylase-like protein
MRRHVARVREERAALTGVLRGLGFRVPESQANCVCACHPEAGAIHAALAARGVLVKRLDPDSPQGPSLRIGCPGDDGDFAYLVGVVRAVMATLAP